MPKWSQWYISPPTGCLLDRQHRNPGMRQQGEGGLKPAVRLVYDTCVSVWSQSYIVSTVSWWDGDTNALLMVSSTWTVSIIICIITIIIANTASGDHSNKSCPGIMVICSSLLCLVLLTHHGWNQHDVAFLLKLWGGGHFSLYKLPQGQTFHWMI